MKYDEMYPDTEVGVEPVPGIVRLEEEVNCASCGELCSWHCKHIDVPSCSMECHHASTQEYLEIQRDAWITESLVEHEDEDLLRRQHNKTVARLVEWAKEEQLMFFYCDAPRSYPFEGEVPHVPVRVIEWERVLAVVSVPTEEPTDPTDDIEEPTPIDVHIEDTLEMDIVDPMGDEDEGDVPEDEEVWMGNDVPYVQGTDAPEPVDLRAFAESLEKEDD